jgi:tetratricopeptide (TPR) repeat protein
MAATKPLLAALAAAVFFAPFAAARAAEAAPAAAPPAATVLQVDGITNQVTDKLWERTDHYWHDGDYNRIVSLLRVVVEADPTFDEAYSVGAWLLWSMGDKAAADRFLDHGVKNGKNKWVAHYNFGELLFVRRQFQDAIPHLNASIQFYGAPAAAWKMLAHSYEKAGNLTKSVELWRTVVKKFPADAAAPRNLARVEKLLESRG